MSRKTLLISLLLLSLFLMPRSASLAVAPKSGFYGYVTLDGAALPLYTPLSAWIGERKVAETVCYVYQNQSFFILNIPAVEDMTDELEGAVIAFRVANLPIEQTAAWRAGQNARISLSAVTPPPRPIKVRFEGSISDMVPAGENALWTIAGEAVLVTAATVLEPHGYQPTIGDWALVHAVHTQDAALVAEAILVRVGAIEASPYEFRGVIESVDGQIPAQTWLVSGTKVTTHAGTQITGEVVVGHVAEVRGELEASGAVRARSIAISAPEEADRRVEFEGVIEEMQAEWWRVGDVRVWIAGAEIPRQGHVGLAAEVTGQRRSDGSVQASYILVEEVDPSDEQRFSGRVVALSEGSWIIELGTGAQLTVYLDASSFIDESRAPAVTGNLAHVLAILRSDGSLLALRIRLERPN